MPSSLPQSIFTILDVYNGNNGAWPNPVITNPRFGNGTTGNDDIRITNPIAGVNGMAGHDRITIENGIVSVINGGAGDDQIFGSTGIDTILGGDGDDYIVGGAGADILAGNLGIDTLSYESSSAAVSVNMSMVVLGNISVSGGHANLDQVGNSFENVVGSNFDDFILGNDEDNVLVGLNGRDHLDGGLGNDTLIGGALSDDLFGGVGNDTFLYLAMSDSLPDNNRDRILDFGDSDKFDLSRIDANLAQQGDQAFEFVHLVESSEDVNPGQVGYVHLPDAAVRIYVSQAGGGDMEIDVRALSNKFPIPDFIL